MLWRRGGAKEKAARQAEKGQTQDARIREREHPAGGVYCCASDGGGVAEHKAASCARRLMSKSLRRPGRRVAKRARSTSRIYFVTAPSEVNSTKKLVVSAENRLRTVESLIHIIVFVLQETGILYEPSRRRVVIIHRDCFGEEPERSLSFFYLS